MAYRSIYGLGVFFDAVFAFGYVGLGGVGFFFVFFFAVTFRFTIGFFLAVGYLTRSFGGLATYEKSCWYYFSFGGAGFSGFVKCFSRSLLRYLLQVTLWRTVHGYRTVYGNGFIRCRGEKGTNWRCRSRRLMAFSGTLGGGFCRFGGGIRFTRGCPLFCYSGRCGCRNTNGTTRCPFRRGRIVGNGAGCANASR